MDTENKISSKLWIPAIGLIICGFCALVGSFPALTDAYDTTFTHRLGSAISAVITSYLLLMFMPLPIEQHWIDKVRIGAVLTFGAAVIGVFCWSPIAPATERQTATFFCSCVSIFDGIIVLIAAFATGLTAYFLGYPNGKHTAMAAVPMGVGIWGLRSGVMENLLIYHGDAENYKMLYMSLRWEGIFWFLVIAAGYFGVKTAVKLCEDKPEPETDEKKKNQTTDIVLPLAVCCAVSWLLTNIFVQAPKIPTKQFGDIIAQPQQAQIAFGLLASFGISAYLIKRYMNARIEIPAISTVVFSFAAAIYYGKESSKALSEYMPPSFFESSLGAVLPIQIISFGTLGVLLGYAVAVLSHHKKMLLEEDKAVKQ